MKRSLADVILASGKRKEFLLFLQNGPGEMQQILSKIKTTRQSLLPQVRLLEEHYLVTHYNDTYELTTLGRVVVSEMVPLLRTVDLFDDDIEYWGTHNLSFLPSHLMETISKLRKCNVVSPPITNLYNVYDQFHEASMNSRSLYVITTFFFPNYIELLSGLIRNNVTVRFIISRDLLEKVRARQDTQFKEMLNSEYLNFFVYGGELEFLSLGFNDYCVLARLLKEDGGSDNKFVHCISPGALEWSKELFEHYLNDSLPIHRFRLS